jgi:hypothetical protein
LKPDKGVNQHVFRGTQALSDALFEPIFAHLNSFLMYLGIVMARLLKVGRQSGSIQVKIGIQSGSFPLGGGRYYTDT